MKTTTSEIDKKFDNGESVIGDLDLAKARLRSPVKSSTLSGHAVQ